MEDIGNFMTMKTSQVQEASNLSGGGGGFVLENNNFREFLEFLIKYVRGGGKPSPPHESEWIESFEDEVVRLAKKCSKHTEFKAKIQLWEQLLQGSYITISEGADYNSKVELFARHTLLILVSKIITETLEQCEQVTTYKEKQHRIAGEGFHGWITDAAGNLGRSFLKKLIDKVELYEWRSPNRDVLKNLYQYVIPKNIRHDFGEYYTPDWLARAMCEEILTEKVCSKLIDDYFKKKTPIILDPSCGSGTFLYHVCVLLLKAAKKHKKLGSNIQAQSNAISSMVMGIDIHPVAVELAKATMLTALPTAPTKINVYLGDSLQWDAKIDQVEQYSSLVYMPTGDKKNPEIMLPLRTIMSERFNEIVDETFNIISKKEYNPNDVIRLWGVEAGILITAVKNTSKFLNRVIAEKKNHVWRSYLTNLSQPYRIKNKIDYIIGNPPWVVYNAMSGSPKRQQKFKNESMRMNLWVGRESATQNDLAATFVATCVMVYLKNPKASENSFGFVLPYAVLKTNHWEKFRESSWSIQDKSKKSKKKQRQKIQTVAINQAWDLKKIRKIPFNTTSAVIFGARILEGNKLHQTTIENIRKAEMLDGQIILEHETWNKAKRKFKFTDTIKIKIDVNKSYYANKFRNGATLFPYVLCITNKINRVRDGICSITTLQSKGVWKKIKPYKDIEIEEEYVHKIVFPSNIVPFAIMANEYLIAPRFNQKFENTNNCAECFRVFWNKIELKYKETKTEQAPATLIEQIDYKSKLSTQIKLNGQKVVYISSGSVMKAALIPKNVYVSHQFFYYSSENPEELYYLCAILNAPRLSNFFKEHCRKSDRDFLSEPPRNLPLEKYNAKNEQHKNLARLGELAHNKIIDFLKTSAKISNKTNQNFDKECRAIIKPILDKIDVNVDMLFRDYTQTAIQVYPSKPIKKRKKTAEELKNLNAFR